MNPVRHLQPRDRRALTVGATLLLAAGALRFAVLPYRHARATLQARIAEQRGLLARELGILQSAPTQTLELARARAALEIIGPTLLPARDPLGATSSLVEGVGDAARRAGVQLEGIESRSPEPIAGDLVAVRIDIRGRTDFEGLLRWLDALQAGPRLLQIDGLTVAESNAGSVPDSNDTEVLLLAASVRGFVRSGSER